MTLIAFAVHRWQITLVTFLLIATLGLQAFLTIPRSADPHFPFPVVIVTAVLPGADAAEVEETVAKPIEQAIQGLDNVYSISSTSSNGVAVVGVDFDHGTDADQALDRVVREVNAIRGQLPTGIARLAYRRARTTEAAIAQFSLVSETASWRRMDKYAQDIRERLNVVQGVRAVTIQGLAEPEVRVAIDTARLSEAGIPPINVARAVEAGGATIATGAVNAGKRRLNVDAGGAYRSLDEIRGTVLRGEPGRAVTIGDIAAVDWAESEQLVLARHDGKRAVFIAVKQKDGANAPQVRAAIEAALGRIRATLPADMQLVTAFDQSRDVDRRMSQLTTDFAIALALVLVTLIPLGWRASVVVMASIPLSLAMGVFILAQLGYSLNQISISGFIISLGLLVDDSIVVTENIERHLREGEDAVAAAVSGTSQIALAVLGSTGVLLFAFLPLAFLPEGAGDFVRGLPMAVLVTVASSLLVSLTIIPFIASRLLRPEANPEGNRALRAINGAIHRIYRPILHRALARPRLTVWGSMLICTGALATIPLIGFSLFPTSDSPYFLVRVEAPEGSGIAATDRAVRDVSAIIAKMPGVVARMDNVGRGNPQIFYNVIAREDDTRYGEVFVTLEDWQASETPAMLDRLRRQLDTYADARVTVVQFDNGPPIEAPVAIRLSGPEIGVLKRLAGEVQAIMTATPGLRDVDNPLAVDRVDLDVGFDPAAAALLGVNAADVRRSIRMALSGERASSFRDAEGDSYPVTVRLPMAANQPVSALGQIYVPSANDVAIPLGKVARPRLKSAPAQITRYKLERIVTVKAYNERGALPSRLNQQVVGKLEKMKFPDGYRWSEAGAAESSARNTAGIGGAILLAVFGIFAVLVAEFGRFREVAVVAGVIPLGLFGGLVALLLTGNSLSFLATIGFVALIGIEIKNSILLVDFTTQLRKDGMPLMEAIERAGEIRFLPVLLTSVTAIGGLLPLALSGSPLYSPLSWVIIGGLVSSTLLSRVVTPVMYYLAARHADADLPTAGRI